MVKRSLFIAVLACACAANATAQDAKATIGAVSKALGADALKTVQYSATGFDYALGQNPNASAPWPKFIEKSYTRGIDFEATASRVDRVRLQGENPPRGGGQQPIIGEQSQSNVVSGSSPWAQQLEIWMMPHAFVRAAAARNATVAPAPGGAKQTVITFVGDNKAPVKAYVDEKNLIARVETMIDHPVMGDMPFVAVYSDYKDVGGGVQFPMHIVQQQGGHPVFDLRVSDVKINAPVNTQPPQGRGGAPAAAAQAPPPVTVEKLSDGVYVMTGGYTVIAIDFKDYIALIESGQSEERALAVIAEAKRLIPNKPIRYVINTHSHFDHAGGLRAFVAEGSTILTHESNKAYLEKVLSLPHTLNPDKAQGSGKKPILEGMGDRKILTDGTHVLELHHLKNFLHHDGMLVAYLPKEKVLLEADAYNPQPPAATPPNPPSPYTLSLADNIQRLKLDVQRIIPVHYPADNRVVTISEMTRWLGRAGTN
ncbi:MAG TPA: MBL fold metallo-hydrolase [Vicinamibacterales bacterium]|nr:MBL fold metallo-hydrolase [Vicinamibacterales bacterium]